MLLVVFFNRHQMFCNVNEILRKLITAKMSNINTQNQSRRIHVSGFYLFRAQGTLFF